MRLLESGDPWFAAAYTLIVGVAVALVIGPGAVRLLARRILRDEDRAQRISLTAFWGVVAIFGLVAVGRLVGGTAAQSGLTSAASRLFTGLPDLIVALVLIVVGSVLATAARSVVWRVVTARRPRYADPLAAFASVAVLTVALLLAARQIGVRTVLLDWLVVATAGAVCLAFGLAVGLGGRSYAEAIAAGRHAETILTVGDLVEVDGRRGRVLKLGSTSVRLGLPGGTVAEIPNPLLLASTVVVFEHDEGAAQGPAAQAGDGAKRAKRHGGASPARRDSRGDDDPEDHATVVVEPSEVDDEAPTRMFQPAEPAGPSGVGSSPELTHVLERDEIDGERARQGRTPAQEDREGEHTDIFAADEGPPRR